MPLAERSHHSTLLDFLKATKNLYIHLRYIPTLKSANLSMDTQTMMNASCMVLTLSEELAWQHSPIQPKVSVTTTGPLTGDGVGGAVERHSVMVKGVVISVKIPDDFDPNGSVEVVIHPKQYFNGLEKIPIDYDVTATFRKCDVESYFGLEGEEVELGGWVTAAEPSVLKRAQHVNRVNREASYKVDTRTLKGQAYNLVVRESSYRDSTRVTLVLRDMTFYSDVECLFVTEKEKIVAESLQLGAEVTIRGHVMLLNGRPVSLVGPSLMS